MYMDRSHPILLWRRSVVCERENVVRRVEGQVRLSRVVVVSIFCFLFVSYGFGEVSSQGLSREAMAATPAVSVSVGCDGNPETTRVHNNANHSVKIRSVGSVYQPRSNEPFHVSRNLGAGKAITFETGYAANSNTLTRQYIYNSDVGSKEGARVATSVGTFVDRCN